MILRSQRNSLRVVQIIMNPDIDERSDRASSPDEVDSDDSSVKISLKSQLSCDPEMKQMMKEMMKEKRNGKLSN